METVIQEPSSLQELNAASQKTDQIISRKWLIFPVASLASWILYGAYSIRSLLNNLLDATFWLGLFIILGLTFSVGTGWLVYRVIDQRNKHFGRDIAFLSKTIEQLQTNITVQNNISLQILASNLERDLATTIERDHEHSGILWGLLSMIPFVGWLVIIVLTQLVLGNFKHHRATESLLYGEIYNVAGQRPDQSNRTNATIVQTGFMQLTIVTVLAVLVGFIATFTLYYFLSINSIGTILLSWIGILAVLSLYLAIVSPSEHFVRHRILDSSFQHMFNNFPSTTNAGA